MQDSVLMQMLLLLLLLFLHNANKIKKYNYLVWGKHARQGLAFQPSVARQNYTHIRSVQIKSMTGK